MRASHLLLAASVALLSACASSVGSKNPSMGSEIPEEATGDNEDFTTDLGSPDEEPPALAPMTGEEAMMAAPLESPHQWYSEWPEVEYSLAPTQSLVKSFGSMTDKLQDLYNDNSTHRETIYCGCSFDEDKNIDPNCDWTSASPSSRSKRVEWEHMVPASRYGGFRACWTEPQENCSKPGRSCCQKTGIDTNFHTMVSDLHNLVPSIGEINLKRLNHPYGETEAVSVKIVAA